jgi:AcrR family transcriptional regulator
VIDRHGREALSLRGLADELGVTPMALYRYFADKDELLDAILAAALAPTADPATAAKPWDIQLEHAIRDMHHALHQRRAIAELMALRRPGQQLDELRQRLLATTAQSGMSEQEATDALRTLTSYALGFTLVTTTTADTNAPRHATSQASFDYGLSLLMDALRAKHNPERHAKVTNSPPRHRKR